MLISVGRPKMTIRALSQNESEDKVGSYKMPIWNVHVTLDFKFVFQNGISNRNFKLSRQMALQIAMQIYISNVIFKKHFTGHGGTIWAITGEPVLCIAGALVPRRTPAYRGVRKPIL